MVSRGELDWPGQAQGNRLQPGIVEAAAAGGLVAELAGGDQRLVPEYLGYHVDSEADVVAVLQPEPRRQRADRYVGCQVDPFLQSGATRGKGHVAVTDQRLAGECGEASGPTGYRRVDVGDHAEHAAIEELNAALTRGIVPREDHVALAHGGRAGERREGEGADSARDRRRRVGHRGEGGAIELVHPLCRAA